nr:MAG TPA: hypothetical protein [Bacteriophage sp.]
MLKSPFNIFSPFPNFLKKVGQKLLCRFSLTKLYK